MTWIEHLLGIAAMVWIGSFILGLPALAACMVSSMITQDEERANGGERWRNSRQ